MTDPGRSTPHTRSGYPWHCAALGFLALVGGAGERALAAAPTLPGAGWSVPADTLPSVDEIAAWLGPEGDLERGREGIRLRARAGGTDEENRWLQLLSALDRIGSEIAPTAVRAVALSEEGNPLEGSHLLLDLLDGSDAQEPAPLMALAALLAERDDPILAAELRVRLLETHPTAPEAPEAGLRHARWLLSIVSRREEGLALLEELIVSRPEHPVTPEARRLFLRERTAAPATDSPAAPL